MTLSLKDFYSEEISTFQKNGASSALKQLWARGNSLFQTMEFPTLKDEAWRNTNIRPLLGEAFARTAMKEISAEEIENTVASLPIQEEDYLLVTVNGIFHPEISRVPVIAGSCFGGLRRALQSEESKRIEALLDSSPQPKHIFTALNEAFVDDGIVISLSEGVALPHTLHVLCLSAGGEEPQAIHERLLVDVGRDASAVLAIHHVTLDDRAPIFKTFVEDYRFNNNASLTRLESIRDSSSLYRIGHLSVEQKEGTRLDSFSLALDGAKLTRNEIEVSLVESDCISNLYGLALNRERDLLDNDLLIHHHAPDCESRMRYKQMLQDSSRGVFTGKIHVDQTAQKTNSEQLSANILLSPQA